MAVVQPVVTYIGNSQGITVTWSGMNTGDTGGPVDFVNFTNKTFQCTGTTITTVNIEGSNDVVDPPVNFSTLNNINGTALAFTAAGIRRSDDTPRRVRPNVVSGSNVTVSFTAVNGWAGTGR
jgi:hypothetical protein